ncbi:MAG: hypothetical protein P0111_02340 [Nitrospira sp.]|nr:hypothetical protein [Nitrospira sp.]
MECAYRGWQIDPKGRGRTIPSQVQDSPVHPDKIGVATYPCRERDGYVWVFISDPSRPEQPILEVPPLPLPASPFRMIHISTVLDCTIDDGNTPAKWYYRLKAAHLDSVQTGRPFDHPLKDRVTLRWRS